MKKTTKEPKKLLLTKEVVRELKRLNEDELHAVAGGLSAGIHPSCG